MLVPFIFIVHFSSCLFMTGVIWTVQQVHYPTFTRIDRTRFREFCEFHQRNISLVVGPAMGLELVSGFALFWYPPVLLNFFLLFLNFASIVGLWLSTYFFSVPCHTYLTNEFSQSILRRLIITNWVRTVIWSVRSLVLAIWLGQWLAI